MKRFLLNPNPDVVVDAQRTWQELGLPSFWQEAIDVLVPLSMPRSIQILALTNYQIHESRRNLIVSAPTNGGKSLVGLIPLLQAIKLGERAILLEPLRAIAREKLEELQILAPKLSEVMGFPLRVSISTGDYRLDDEHFASPPSKAGELMIATPERLEAILRNSANAEWVDSIGAVCVDEAHLLTSPHRGPTLDFLITSLLCLPAPPRLVLLSATLGNTQKAEMWLAPCDVVKVTDRYPPLEKEVIQLEPDDDLEGVTIRLTKECLAASDNNLLLFVYQTRSAEKLASILTKSLDRSAGPQGAMAYHAQMNLAQRNRVREAFDKGLTRCVVSTTALGLGVNLPATHVIVRDTIFPGVGALNNGELLQMMGRAGRGDRTGHSIAIVRSTDNRDVKTLLKELTDETIPDFSPPYQSMHGSQVVTVATQIASYLARHGNAGVSLAQMQSFFERSFVSQNLVSSLPQSLEWLTDPSHMLAYSNEQENYQLTVLGQKAVRGVLPLTIAAGFGQLIRDILTIDPSDRLLSNWQPLDHLLILGLLHERRHSLRVYSASLHEQIDGWMEESPERKSLIFREWVRGLPGFSRADEIMGSLGITIPTAGQTKGDWACKTAYLSLFNALVMWEMCQGQAVQVLTRRWRVPALEGIEERWRDEFLWLLSGLAQVLDLRCFFFHLKENCEADSERIRAVEKQLGGMRYQVFDLQEQMKYCSPLGPMLRSLRRIHENKPGSIVGAGSIRRLEGAGIRSLTDLIPLSTENLVDLGIRRDFARQISNYVHRRQQ